MRGSIKQESQKLRTGSDEDLWPLKCKSLARLALFDGGNGFYLIITATEPGPDTIRTVYISTVWT